MAQIEMLKEKATEIRKSIVTMINKANSGHPGGSLSIADILSVLYFHEMKINPENPKDINRDRFVLSKGHASPAIYATLAERGYFSKDLLPTFRKYGSILQGHPDMKKVPGVDMSTGSLGQGLSVDQIVEMPNRGKQLNPSRCKYEWPEGSGRRYNLRQLAHIANIPYWTLYSRVQSGKSITEIMEG